MDFKIKRFWPVQTIRENHMIGTVHIEFPAWGIEILGISVYFRREPSKTKRQLWIYLCMRRDIDRGVSYPMFVFANRVIGKLFKKALTEDVLKHLVTMKFPEFTEFQPVIDSYAEKLRNPKQSKGGDKGEAPKKNNKKSPPE